MNSERPEGWREARKTEMLRYEQELWSRGVRLVAGLDEAGRGPLAGPVVAAAVIVAPDFFIPEVDDSKRLSPAVRESLFDVISAGAMAVGVGTVESDVIDRINILNATFRAMHMALARLPIEPGHLLIDGNRFVSDVPLLRADWNTPAIPSFRERTEGIRSTPFTTIVRGDSLSFSIAAASIIAKVTRDRLMVRFDEMYPGYGFARHKGYGTRQHRDAIGRLGPCPIHRRSFHLNRQEEMAL